MGARIGTWRVFSQRTRISGLVEIDAKIAQSTVTYINGTCLIGIDNQHVDVRDQSTRFFLGLERAINGSGVLLSRRIPGYPFHPPFHSSPCSLKPTISFAPHVRSSNQANHKSSCKSLHRFSPLHRTPAPNIRYRSAPLEVHHRRRLGHCFFLRRFPRSAP